MNSNPTVGKNKSYVHVVWLVCRKNRLEKQPARVEPAKLYVFHNKVCSNIGTKSLYINLLKLIIIYLKKMLLSAEYLLVSDNNI